MFRGDITTPLEHRAVAAYMWCIFDCLKDQWLTPHCPVRAWAHRLTLLQYQLFTHSSPLVFSQLKNGKMYTAFFITLSSERHTLSNGRGLGRGICNYKYIQLECWVRLKECMCPLLHSLHTWNVRVYTNIVSIIKITTLNDVEYVKRERPAASSCKYETMKNAFVQIKY